MLTDQEKFAIYSATDLVVAAMDLVDTNPCSPWRHTATCRPMIHMTMWCPSRTRAAQVGSSHALMLIEKHPLLSLG
jgi:hypothetical protein